MNGPSFVLESPTPSASLPEVRNHTRFPSQYFQMLDTDDHIYHAMVMRVTYDLQQLDPLGFPALARKQPPLLDADQFYGQPNTSSPIQESDFAPYKPRCDIVFAHANAYAPQGIPTARWPIAAKVGDWTKYLMVCGPRWIRPGALGWKLDEPEAAAEVCIQYENAFGGTCQWPEILPDGVEAEILSHFPSNPVGCGFFDKQWVKKAEPKQIKAPQIEVIDRVFDRHSISSQDYPAVGLGCVGRWWQPRAQLAGSYDEQWKKSRWPALPKDFDFGYWNSVPMDQQIKYPKGGEKIHLVGLTPGGGHFLARLPENHPYTLVTLDAGPILKRPMPIDTLIFDMRDMTLTCVHRTNVASNAGIRMIEVAQDRKE